MREARRTDAGDPPNAETTPTGSVRLTVWVDADSCPVAVREILNRAAVRRGFALVYCANRAIAGLSDDTAGRELRVVEDGPVDEYLARELARSARGRALLVTRDIPLAERILSLGVAVMNDRGERFDRGTVAHRRSIRDAGAAIRSAGLETMPRARRFGPKERKAFADALDRFLTEVLQ